MKEMILVKDLSKSYKIFQRGISGDFWALDGINFSVNPGEVVGVIGNNGAGKSTLLKILSRITQPTRGEAIFRGRLGSLLEVGTGFHPELTGRENIFMNAAIIGMKRHEIKRKFDEIVGFSEIGKFIDTPVKRYSSGMYVRLAFSVAAHLEPEILIIDEVLAVGDISFQKKCLGRMGEASKSGRTILFVSHNLGAIQSLCSRCLFLENGKLVHSGPSSETIATYLSHTFESPEAEKCFEDRMQLPAQVTKMAVLNDADAPQLEHSLGAKVIISVDYIIRRPLRDITIAALTSKDGTPLLYSYEKESDGALGEAREPGKYRTYIQLPSFLFKEGNYEVGIEIGSGMENISDPKARIQFRMINSQEDLTHRSYRADRPGLISYKTPWQTMFLGK